MKYTILLVMACMTAAEPLLVAEPYSEQLAALKSEVAKTIPKVDGSQEAALIAARDAVVVAETKANASQQAIDKIHRAKALVDHAKGKWIGGAEKSISLAQAALQKAHTEAERETAKNDLAKWQANKEDGFKALKERQEAWEKAKANEPDLAKANQSAQDALTQARDREHAASKALLSCLEPCLASDKLDAWLVKAAVLSDATPSALAEFSQQSKAQETMLDNLLSDTALMKQMLEAGGAKFGKYGHAMEIFTAIQTASPQSREGTLQRLALATSLEHAKPIEQSNPKDQTSAPSIVDPVKRYLHYEKAYLAGDLDPAFKDFSTWELRMVINCDAPDEILSWGREMLRNYRPDHIYNPDYGWRYSSTVRTEVPYGSQNVKDDLPALQSYQNIIKDGGVCGRRAFFGRFILRSFGIPTWGVTQHAHAALSHWTPRGWVVNLGAGYEHSWWDKDEAPRSGSDFLLETQARAHGNEYLKVLRARWISRIMGEQEYNERTKTPGGFWSRMAHYQSVALAATSVGLAPLGQEFAEANEVKKKQNTEPAKMTEADREITTSPEGVISLPAVAFEKPKGAYTVMKSFLGGMQMHCTGGFKADYAVDMPKTGNYTLRARVVTAQEGQVFTAIANDAKENQEIAVPYTIGKWRQTRPITLALVAGKNVLHFALRDGCHGVSIKDFTLTPEP